MSWVGRDDGQRVVGSAGRTLDGMNTAEIDSSSTPQRAASTGSAPVALELTGVTKTFGRVEAVRGIDLTIRQGEIVAFLGPNGAGKTTTIDMVLGLSEPTSGTARVFGLEPHHAIRRGLVSAVMQTGGLVKDLTVRETVELTASLFPTARAVPEVIRTAGIEEIADRMVGKCSGGEQQRLRFAMALVSDPELLILDEPTTGMDVNTRRAFWASIRADAEQGRTVIFATHYLEEADAYADRIVLVRRGQIVADGSAAEVRALGAGRTVRVTWPNAEVEQLRTVDGVEGIDVRGEQVLVHAKDSDAVARYLLTRTPAYDLEIEARGLEDAFVALTSDDDLMTESEK
ncbi:putative ABC transporter ATP-binding protein [Nostocoides japonicum T1-X7]|uniref:Putative ABC transporter ATP-binding protein n=2 Tax=Nostocoides japonicum TaxID=99481 RepID=A0A077LXQ4_9MICO|nr:putative ABC transporter ATP-binding protein [Tetrasphaera japonica T1-X7]